MEMPLEVKEYFAAERRTIRKVVPNADFSLTLTFDNGEVKVYEMKDTINKGVFAKIKPRFSTAFIDSDTGAVAWDIDPTIDSNVVWNNRVDLCPDTCYIYSKKV